MDQEQPKKETMLGIIKNSVKEGSTDSFSRLTGVFVFAVLNFCMIIITVTFCHKISTVDFNKQVDPGLFKWLLYLSLLFLVMALTAMSLYGINCWRYVVALKNGGPIPGDEAAAIQQDASSSPANKALTIATAKTVDVAATTAAAPSPRSLD